MESIGHFAVRMRNRFHLVSKTQSDAAGCRGKSVATDHVKAFETIDRDAAGTFQISDFDMVTTEGPRDTMRALEYGKVECVILGEGQLRALQRRDREKKAKVLWSSKESIPGVVVAFPSATEEERAALVPQLANVCQGRGGRICGSVRVTDLGGPDTTGTASGGAAPKPSS
jgi:hypothetical protein